MNTTVFLSGIHGVGKTTFCKKVAKEANMEHVVASSILKEYKTYHKKNKRRRDIDNETDFITQWMTQKLIETKTILFDAHFVLFNSQNNLIKVRKEIFCQLGISKIILLIDDVVSIRARLNMRDGKDFSLDFLQKLQDAEIHYSREVADMLHVEYKVFDISDIGQDNTERALLDYLQ